MQITKVIVDFVFEGEQAFVARYERTVHIRDELGQRVARTLMSKEPIIGRFLPSGSVQLYSGEPGSMGKTGGAIKRHLVDFSQAISQEQLPKP